MIRRSTMPPQRYARTGLLAVDPSAFLELFIVPSSRESELIGSTCVIDICGPLDQHDSGWGDSYEAIRGRVAEACASSALAILLRIDSPGGAVSGCFETVRAIRAMCAAAGKPLYAYCDHATSAGYALASAASYIAASSTAILGSIGVIETRTDLSARNAAEGIRVEFIASGARKVDGRVDAPITDAELTAKREIVDAIAGVFFALVEEMRGIPAPEVAAQQAAVYHAEAAIVARLVDQVASFENILTQIATGGFTVMPSPYDKARAALEEAAKGDDANAAAARRALAAMDNGGGDDDKDKPVDPDADTDAADADAGGDDPPADADDDAPPPPAKPDPAASTPGAGAATQASAASTHSIALAAMAKAHDLEAQLASDRVHAERVRLLNTRRDFDRELRAELMKASTPIETVRSMVKTLKRKPVPAAAATAAATATGTRGDNQGGTTPAAAVVGSGAPGTEDPRADMDARMGLTQTTLGVTRTRNMLLFGVVNKPADAASSGQGVTK
jgi:ClpP class serine protease